VDVDVRFALQSIRRSLMKFVHTILPERAPFPDPRPGWRGRIARALGGTPNAAVETTALPNPQSAIPFRAGGSTLQPIRNPQSAIRNPQFIIQNHWHPIEGKIRP
jgi:hypothetical protein